MLPVGRRRGQVGGARIALRAIAALNGDSPWKICRRAVQLLVEEIAPAPDRLHQEQARRNDVRPDTQRMPLPADIGNAGKRSGQQAPIDAEARVGRQDDGKQIALVELPLVDDVVEPPTDKRSDGDNQHAVEDQLRILPTEARLATEEPVRGPKADGICDSVPMHGKRADLDGDGTRSEVEHRPGV